MKQYYTTAILMVLIAGAALFWQEIMAAFAGMSPLEALKTIVTYILHVAIGTIAAVVVFGLPKIVQPWMRMIRKRRSGLNAQREQKSPRMPRLTPEQKFWLMMVKAGQTRSSAPTSSAPTSKLPRKLNVKW